MSKLSEEYKEKLHNLGMPIEEVINKLPVKTLLRIGKRVCSTDYAVRFYNNKQHPKFHLNKKALRHAIRREWVQGAFKYQERILDILEDEGYVKESKILESEPLPLAVCNICHKVMLEGKGCIPSTFIDSDGNDVSAYKYGEEPGYEEDTTTPCSDCGCEAGQSHHPECDMERCPVCGEQALFRIYGHVRKFENEETTWR
jgi:hypothetical protein